MTNKEVDYSEIPVREPELGGTVTGKVLKDKETKQIKEIKITLSDGFSKDADKEQIEVIYDLISSLYEDYQGN